MIHKTDVTNEFIVFSWCWWYWCVGEKAVNAIVFRMFCSGFFSFIFIYFLLSFFFYLLLLLSILWQTKQAHKKNCMQSNLWLLGLLVGYLLFLLLLFCLFYHSPFAYKTKQKIFYKIFFSFSSFTFFYRTVDTYITRIANSNLIKNCKGKKKYTKTFLFYSRYVYNFSTSTGTLYVYVHRRKYIYLFMAKIVRFPFWRVCTTEKLHSDWCWMFCVDLYISQPTSYSTHKTKYTIW